MDYDYYKVYFGSDNTGYDNLVLCDTLEFVELELNRATIYDFYLVVGHNSLLDEDDVIARGRIELNRTHIKEGR